MSECGRCGGSVPSVELSLKARLEASEAEVKRLRDSEAKHRAWVDAFSEEQASLRSQLAAMTEALEAYRHDHDTSTSGEYKACCCDDCRRAQKALSPTSAKEWEETVRENERERCAKVAEAYEPRCESCPRGVAAAIRAVK